MTHKLLLADDSVTIQRVVELTFSGEDVQVVTVSDGEQAIARIPIERPDIVLADIGMPKRSGYDVSAFVKSRPDLWHIPVLLLAGAFEPVDDARAQQVKCDGVLVKPFEPQQVVSRVRELVGNAKEKVLQSISVPVPQPVGVATPAGAVEMAESRVSQPAPVMRKAEPKLDEYFQGLDEALAGLDGRTEGRQPPVMHDVDDYRTGDVPTIEKLLGSDQRRDSTMPEMPFGGAGLGSSALDELTPQPARTTDAPAQLAGSNVIVDAFHALLAMEQGDPQPPTRTQVPTAAPPAVTEELVDEVTRRVIERLAPGTAHDLVRQVVSEVAERLIREEIARIKSAVSARR